MVSINEEYQEAGSISDSELKRQYWEVAKGLQAVDNLKTSAYLNAVVEEALAEGHDTPAVIAMLNQYYDESNGSANPDTREADYVSARIEGLLAHQSSFNFSPVALKRIHRELFQDVLPAEWVGVYRTVDITKTEEVLFGKSVQYAPHDDIGEQLNYDFSQEKKYQYYLPMDSAQIKNLSGFTSAIWQTHPFREGNTRTIAVFIIQYLQSIGLKVSNESFKNYAKFFRDALVRSNYANIQLDIRVEWSYIIAFYENVLSCAQHDLSLLDLKCYQLDK